VWPADLWLTTVVPAPFGATLASMAAAVPVAGGSSSLLGPFRVVALVVAVGFGALVSAGFPPSGSTVTTYADASATATVMGLFAGGSLLAAGALAVWSGPSRAVGAMLVASGLLWFSPDWAGWEGGPAVVRGLADVVTPLLPVVLLGLVAAVSGRRLRTVAAVAMAVGVLSAGLAAVDDPFLDPVCWPTCSDSALLISSRPRLADVLSVGLSAAWLGIAGAVWFGAARRWRAASTVARRWNGTLFGGLAVVGAVEVAYGAAVLIGTETAHDPLFLRLHVGRAAAWSLLALAAAWTTYRHLGRRRALSTLAAALETTGEPGSLAGTLRSVTGDRELDVRYPVGDGERQVDAEGRTVASPPGPGRTSTPLRRGDRTVAVLVHDQAVLPVEALDGVLGPAARLALENERLAAELLARAHDVAESQRRIVLTGDQARRRLERDLHDGAQQSLLALSFRLRLARSAAERAGEETTVAELDRGGELVQGALDDLRSLAHGIHPAVLSQSGLAAALRSLADECPVPLELDTVADQRFDPSVELAAWMVVRDVAWRDGSEQATAVTVRVVREGGGLVVQLDGAGSELPTGTTDRVGALGGRIVATAIGLRVELPCGS
jgi:signal transduction histidine kinase